MPPPLQASLRPMPHGGQRLWLLHQPPAGTPARGSVLYVHPWAEEMNKSRRMAALAARALADDGWTVLQPDLAGCGDSSGELAEASVALWLDDLAVAVAELQQGQPGAPLWLWGLRSGALWCAALAARLQPCPHLLLWQPVQQGKALLQQFLRLKAAAQLADGGGKGVVEGLRAQLAQGHAVEVAGYVIGAELARGLEQATLAPPPLPVGAAPPPRLAWLELSTADDATLSPAAQAALPRWQQAGWQAKGRAVHGPMFWQTTEIEDAPALVPATVSALRGAPH